MTVAPESNKTPFFASHQRSRGLLNSGAPLPSASEVSMTVTLRPSLTRNSAVSQPCIGAEDDHPFTNGHIEPAQPPQEVRDANFMKNFARLWRDSLLTPDFCRSPVFPAGGHSPRGDDDRIRVFLFDQGDIHLFAKWT